MDKTDSRLACERCECVERCKNIDYPKNAEMKSSSFCGLQTDAVAEQYETEQVRYYCLYIQGPPTSMYIHVPYSSA
jgi:hypothetical protein